jgi:5'-deoxynucleotidase YfbR-like HD superfamily hydrolase
MKCRFNGHCREFYSVAEHSVRVSLFLEPSGSKLALWGLMHDAAEAYLADLGAPLKKYFHVHHDNKIETFDAAEDRLLAVIAQALQFPAIDYSALREADLTLLATECRDLLDTPPQEWNLPFAPLAQPIRPVSPIEAERQFLTRFTQLQTLKPPL